MFLVCPVLFAALLRGVQAFSPVPSVPDRVDALVGSCVVIPCSFTPLAPLPNGRQGRVNVRVTFRGGGRFFPLRSTAFNSEDREQVSRDYQGRTALFGRTADGDCSVKIQKVSLHDSQAFEIELKAGDDLLWGKPRTFNLNVSETPESPVISGTGSATEGQVVTLNCTVSYCCPSKPPTLQWYWERGVQGNSTEREEVLYPRAHMPVLLASVSFTTSYPVKPRLRCEASYPGDKTVSALKNLHVTFSPKDVKVQVQTLTVLEGGNALLACSCKADPPVSEYRWSYTQSGRTVNLHTRVHTVRVYNVTRDMRVRCSAQNLIGRGESRLTDLHVQYKPVILHLSSSCAVEGSEVLCRCPVDSNPRPTVTWSVNGSVPPSGYNMSVTYDRGTTIAVLSGHMDKPLRVVCFAVNALGNDSHTLLQGGEATGSLLWLVIPAVAVCLAMFLLSLLLLHYCRKKTGKRVLNRPPAEYPGDLGMYQDRTPLYINCTEVTHIYTNGSYQLVYQNCTPLFVHTKQTRPMARRGGERRMGSRRRGERRGGERRGGERRGGGGGGGESQGHVGARATREIRSPAEAETDTAIYLEII